MKSRTKLQTDEKKQAAADVLFQYSKFVMACIGNQVRPCDLRLHLMKVASRFLFKLLIFWFYLFLTKTCWSFFVAFPCGGMMWWIIVHLIKSRGLWTLRALSDSCLNFFMVFLFYFIFLPLQEISGMPTSLKKESSQRAASPDAMGESSSSGTARLDKPDSFRVL